MAYLRLLFYVGGIYASFLTWAILQERVTSQEYEGEKFKFFILMNVMQSAMSASVAFITIKAFGEKLPSMTKDMGLGYFQIAVTNSLASPFGYAALSHIDYPTFVLAKACKLIPVMLTGTILYRKKFQWFKYVSVLLITAGVASFTFFSPAKKHKGAASTSFFGLGLIFINLFLDGFTNSTQDQLFKKFSMTSRSMMFFMNSASTILMSIYLVSSFFLNQAYPSIGETLGFELNQDLSKGVAFCQRHPAVLKDVLFFGLCGALGQSFIFLMMQHFGSLALVSVTVTRKLFTIFISCIFYSHPISQNQIMCIGVVFMGITLEGIMKEREKWIDRKEVGSHAKTEKPQPHKPASVLPNKKATNTRKRNK